MIVSLALYHRPLLHVNEQNLVWRAVRRFDCSPERALVHRGPCTRILWTARHEEEGRMATVGHAPRSTCALIMTAALDLFSKVGYEATSMRQIATAVGIKPPSLYNHFSSKEEILCEIVHNALSEILKGQERAYADNPDTVSRFRSFVRMHATFHARESQAAKIVNHNLSSLSPRHYRRTVADRARYERRFRELLEAGVAERIFDVANTQLTSYAILEMGMGISLWYHRGGTISIDDIATYHEELALRMVGHREGR